MSFARVTAYNKAVEIGLERALHECETWFALYASEYGVFCDDAADFKQGWADAVAYMGGA